MDRRSILPGVEVPGVGLDVFHVLLKKGDPKMTRLTVFSELPEKSRGMGHTGENDPQGSHRHQTRRWRERSR